MVRCVEKLSGEILEHLKRRAENFFSQRIVRARSREEVIESLNNGKVVIMDFCGRECCANEMKEVTHGGKVRGSIVECCGVSVENENAQGKCAWCGMESKQVVYVAKAY